MKKLVILTAAALTALAACCASGDWVYEGQWGSSGSGVAVAPNGNVYVADGFNQCIQYFTPTGSFLGKWGSYGTGNGQLWWPADVALDAGGNRLYVSENGNNRIQYFKRDNPTVAPSSLGRVKALFQ
jgi:DNA-binding beta-propeller fold protein YncE